MAFEGSRFEDRGGNEEQMREHAPDLSMPEEAHPDAPPLTERAVAPDAREGIRAPEALAAPAPRERMEPTSEEALAARLDEARAAYAQAWIHEDNLPQEEKDRVFREYLAAVSAMRARQKEHFAQDPSRTPAERARTMEQMILSFTAEERKRLMQARDAVRIAQRDAAAVASHGRYIMEDYREAAALFGRGTRHVAEWYRSIPPQYRFAIGAGLFAATAGGAYLGLPLLVAAGGGARMATRMLGGGSAALGADAGMQWLQDRKAQREIFGAKQESTWNPDLHFSWNPMRMAAGLFRREATAEQSIEWADQLEAIIKDDDDTRLNDAFIGQARRAGHEKRNRVLIAGLVFTAVAIGMPGKGFRFVGEQTGATEAIRSRAQAWAHDLSHGGIAEAATNQEVSGAPSQRETLYAKIRRWRGVGAPTTASTDAAPKKPAIDKPRTIADPSKIKQVRETLLPQERILVEKRLKEIDQEFQRMNA